MSTLPELLREEKKTLAVARKDAETVKNHMVELVKCRVEIGKSLQKEKAQAKKKRVPWEDWCKKHLPLLQPQADKYIRFAVAEKQAMQLAKDGDIPHSITNAVKLLPTQAESKDLAYASGGGDNGRDSDHWLTPAEYVDAAREVMGSILFDPFSSEEGNQAVRAQRYFTVEDDAFETPWPAQYLETVWMNPPYGRKQVNLAIETFLKHLPGIGSAVVLVNNATDTTWWADLVERCSAVVFTRGRIAFVSPNEDKTMSSNTRGQCFVYFGKNPKGFCDVFKRYGTCWEKSCV